MQKTKAILEITKNEKIFQFQCEINSTLGECFDVLTEMKNFIIDKMKEVPRESKEVKNDDQLEPYCGSCG
jgi:hypothetical protein